MEKARIDINEEIRVEALEKLKTELTNEYVKVCRDSLKNREGGEATLEEQIEIVMDALNTAKAKVPDAINNSIDRYYKDIEDLAANDFIKTRIGTIDRKIGGLEAGNLITICGLPGHGKSALSAQIGVNLAKQGYKTAYLSLEMTHKQLMDRLVRHAGVQIPQQRLRCGKLQEEDWKDLKIHLDRMNKLYLGNLSIYTQEDSQGIENVAMLHKMIRQERPKVVIIDQLNKLNIHGKFAGEFERLQEITKRLKVIAKTEKIIIILQAQINSKSQFNLSEGPKEYNIANSKAMFEESDIVMVVYRYPDQIDENGTELERQNVRVNILKNRQGVSGPVELEFIGSRFLFNDYFEGWNC